MAEEHREEFVNRTQGWVGVQKIDRKGDERAIGVEPGGRVFLTEEEQKLTAEAHRNAKDSPFVEREIVHYDAVTQEEIDRFVSPLLQNVNELADPAADPEPRKPPARRRAAAPST